MKITVFTPTYNRANTIGRVYDSLCNQCYGNFEWVIVDDGSTDCTESLVEGWIKEAKIHIIYKKQPNGGKPSAFNRGVLLASGELFINLDSDDGCIPSALTQIHNDWNEIPIMERDFYTGLSYNCESPSGTRIGDAFPSLIFDSNYIDIRERFAISGEKWDVVRTDLLRAEPYPVFPGEKFIAEYFVLNRLALKYKTRFINKSLRVYYENTEGSISSQSVRIRAKSPRGACLCYKEYALYSKGMFQRFRSIINFLRFSFHNKSGIWRMIVDSAFPLFSIILLPLGYAAYRADLPKLRTA